MSVSILLPAASAHRDGHRGANSTFVVELLDTVKNFLTHNPAARVVCGMDADDRARQLFADKLALSESNTLCRVAGHTFHTADLQQAKYDALEQGSVALDERSVPLCWMWGQLAQLAIGTFQTELLVLLGDDIEMRPPAWVDMVSGKLSGPWKTVTCRCAYTTHAVSITVQPTTVQCVKVQMLSDMTNTFTVSSCETTQIQSSHLFL